MIAIIDYDAGNMKSVEKAFQYLNEDAVITRGKRFWGLTGWYFRA